MELPETTPVSEFYVSRTDLLRSTAQEDIAQSEDCLGDFHQYMEAMEKLLCSSTVRFQEDVWYDAKTGLLLPDFGKGDCKNFSFSEFAEFIEGHKSDIAFVPFSRFTGRCITSEECRVIFGGGERSYPHEPGRVQPCFIIDGKHITGRYLYTQLSWSVKDTEGHGRARSLFLVAAKQSFLCAEENGDFLEKKGVSFNVRGVNKSRSGVFIPVVSLTEQGSDATAEKRREASCIILEKGLVPVGMDAEKIASLSRQYARMKDYLTFSDGGWNINAAEWMGAAEREESNQIQMKASSVKKMLLECDLRRADLTPYPENYLSDKKHGHWELAESKLLHDENFEDTVAIPLPEPFLARDPRRDVRKGGVCAIDFGTRSTVAVCMNGNDIRMIRAGRGDFLNNPSPADYENPTVVELFDYDAFRMAYQEKDGRPLTRWEDLRVSHAALNDLMNAEDQIVSESVFGDLKQWAQRRHGVIELRDQKGLKVELRPYFDLQKGNFDPVEIYAYYLGLYINNMYNGIYLDYVMSFPVRYDSDVKESIRESFERGLQKSLPEIVWKDEGLMRSFQVRRGASEPAAYAACALRELAGCGSIRFPTETEPARFAVFDFGGGTADFDYGIWRKPKEDERGYNFVIENFDAESDLGLGGEKLLNMMAYEVYKENLEEMRDKSIPIPLPNGCIRFDGGELLIGDSLPARMNLRAIGDMLRPLWQEEPGVNYDTFGDATHSVALVADNGKKEPVPLVVPSERLKSILSARIRKGIDNFFFALRRAFGKSLGGECHILLAGNGCKSSLIKKIFPEAMKDYASGDEFRLHMPIGNGKAKEYERTPTGKTGVAFGLIACREGGNDILALDRNEEDSFRFILGSDDGTGHFCPIVSQGAEKNKWYKFIKLTSDSFDIFYTEEPRAAGGTVAIGETERLTCKVHYKGDCADGFAYVRITGSRTAEYTAMSEEGTKSLAKILICEFGKEG